MRSPLWWKYFMSGYPTCCKSHARHCWMVMWDIGDDYETFYKLSIN